LWCKDISVATKENGKFYIWGQNKNGDWVVPTEVKCDSINNTFASSVLSVPVTYQCYVIEVNGEKGKRNASLNCTIGKINFNARNVIGRGTSGAPVFRGVFEGQMEVAVKRFDYFEIADHNIEPLLSLNHKNLVRHYAIESDGMFCYLASELAEWTLEDYIERKKNGEFRDLDVINVLRQISEGLAYLHSQDIINCKIRPHNVLISRPMRPKCDRKAMINNFSISNELISRQKSFSLEVASGWIAREVLQSDNYTFKPTKAIDVFALGCLFYYALNDGNHPFGDRFHRQANVYDGRSDINALKNEESLCKHHLIAAMIDDDPRNRPVMDAVLKHPMFWDSQTILSFIVTASNHIKQEKMDSIKFKRHSNLLSLLEKRADDITKGDWKVNIFDELRKDLEKRKYDGSSVMDLLRAIRNKEEHYDELDENVKKSLEPMPDGFASYFKEKFPLLLAHTYITLQECKTENVLKKYYCDSFNFQPLAAI